MSTKLCTACNTVWNRKDFNRNARTKDGLAYKCRYCAREYYREYIAPALRGRRTMSKWYSPRYTDTTKRLLKKGRAA